jgi:hypothetical protein
VRLLLSKEISMNRCTPGLPLAKAIPGFLLYKTAEALSPNTLRSYQDHLKLWLKHTGDVAVERITPADVCASRSVAWLRHEYQPHRLTGNTAPLSAKTLRNYWVSAATGWLASYLPPRVLAARSKVGNVSAGPDTRISLGPFRASKLASIPGIISPILPGFLPETRCPAGRILARPDGPGEIRVTCRAGIASRSSSLPRQL